MTTQPGMSRTGFRVRRSIWVDDAERLGALVTVPLLVPLPLGDPESLRAKAGHRLQSAVRAWADGRVDDAVRDARLALDFYDRINPPATNDKQPPRQRDLAQRFAALRSAVHSLASGAHHNDAVTADFRYDRSDACAIVACVAALLQRVDGQKQSPSSLTNSGTHATRVGRWVRARPAARARKPSTWEHAVRPMAQSRRETVNACGHRSTTLAV